MCHSRPNATTNGRANPGTFVGTDAKSNRVPHTAAFVISIAHANTDTNSAAHAATAN